MTRAFIRAVSSPWRLTLAVTVCRSGTNPADLLTAATVTPPAADARQADPVLSMLLDRFIPAATRLHPNSRYTDSAKVTRWLTTLADHLRWQAAHGRSGTDLLLVDLWQVSHDNRARVWHTIFALTTYLAGLAVVSWITIGAAHRVDRQRALLPPQLPPPSPPFLLFMVFTLTVTLCLVLESAKSESMTPFELNLGQVRTPKGRRQLALGLGQAIAVRILAVEHLVAGDDEVLGTGDPALDFQEDEVAVRLGSAIARRTPDCCAASPPDRGPGSRSAARTAATARRSTSAVSFT
jgi:hypothetical protein